MTSSAAPPEHLASGHRIASRYTIDSAIGEGASGIVYLATRDEDAQRVALKVIHRHLCGDRQIFRRYHREAEILKRLEGPHVAGLLDFFEDDGLLIIALEHIDGTALDELLRREGRVDIDIAVEIALQICSALESAHRAGVVHRDLKPANVMLGRASPSSAGEPGSSPFIGRVRVVDFGLAKVVHGEQMTTGLTEQDMIFGTPEYMAPEQVRGEDVDPRCDIYALGCMLYEMTVGAVPFKRRTAIAAMTAHLTEEPPSPRSSKRDGTISASFEAVLLRALAKNPADRHQSARAFANALAACRERRVIRSGASTVDGISKTDLQLGRVDLEHAPTVPSDTPVSKSQPRRQRELGLAATLPGEDFRAAARAAVGEGLDKLITGVRSRERLLWIVVALVFAAIGVAIGTLFGTQ